jgi:hypothetical protein
LAQNAPPPVETQPRSGSHASQMSQPPPHSHAQVLGFTTCGAAHVIEQAQVHVVEFSCLGLAQLGTQAP